VERWVSSALTTSGSMTVLPVATCRTLATNCSSTRATRCSPAPHTGPVVGDDLRSGGLRQLRHQGIPVRGVLTAAGVQHDGGRTSGRDVEGKLMPVVGDHMQARRGGRVCRGRGNRGFRTGRGCGLRRRRVSAGGECRYRGDGKDEGQAGPMEPGRFSVWSWK
jgi:hypothetical protein